ncbi:MAG TPA: hypothetical protein VMV92_14210 [Streptosporangiaceae bacterium]|nr:hypothetical protein [Streptosporangiaceae bacterium]
MLAAISRRATAVARSAGSVRNSAAAAGSSWSAVMLAGISSRGPDSLPGRPGRVPALAAGA